MRHDCDFVLARSAVYCVFNLSLSGRCQYRRTVRLLQQMPGHVFIPRTVSQRNNPQKTAVRYVGHDLALLTHGHDRRDFFKIILIFSLFIPVWPNKRLFKPDVFHDHNWSSQTRWRDLSNNVNRNGASYHSLNKISISVAKLLRISSEIFNMFNWSSYCCCRHRLTTEFG